MDQVLDLHTQLLFNLEADVCERQAIGHTAFGRRRIYVVSGGRFRGPRLGGEVLPGGADWLLRGSDGVSEIDVRTTLRTDDGHLIYMHYTGLYCVSQEVKARMDNGEDVSPTEYYFRTTPRFEAGDSPYEWLNHTLAVGVGARTGTGIAYSIYEVQ